MPDTNNTAPLFSIITVVYNAEDYIEETLKNVIEQNFSNFEYIVVDGGSTDNTLSIIGKYRSHIDMLVSEADRGIYDAMNKSTGLAKGKYINFMNAGDRFYAPNTLQLVSDHLASRGSQNEIDVVYGKVVKVSSESSNFQYEKGKQVTANSFFLSVPMCHQTMFIRTQLFREVGLYYSLEYQAGSFYGWLGAYYGYRQSLEYLSFIDERIALYLDGGYSFQMKKVIDRERLLVARKYFPWKYLILNHLIYMVNWVKAEGLILLVNLRLLDSYRKLKYKLNGKAV